MTQSTETLDIAEVEAFGGRIAAILNDAMTALMLSVGHRSGLFDTMAGLDWASASEIAAAARRHERYVREWLGAMVTSGVVDHVPPRVAAGGAQGRETRSPHSSESAERYRLRPEHAALVTHAAERATSPSSPR